MTGYDGLIIDLDGVIWLSGDPIAGAAEAIAALRASGVQVVFVTNEPLRRRTAVASRLTEIGIPAAAADVVTSASVAARLVSALTGLRGQRALVLGPRALREEIAGAGFRLLDGDDAQQAEVVVVAAHEGFDYSELRAATAAVRNGARLFATGSDPVYPTSAGPEPATGAVAAAVEKAGGTLAVVTGKPERIMFDIARAALAGCQRIAVIGDSLTADIAGGRNAELDTILVLTGTTDRADLQGAAVQPDLVADSLASVPAAIAATLAPGWRRDPGGLAAGS